jgi:hypothetical protein
MRSAKQERGNMDIRAYISECRTEIAAIARARDFWSKHILHLRQNGVKPTEDDAAWVKKHIEGLDESSRWFQQHIAEIEKR